MGLTTGNDSKVGMDNADTRGTSGSDQKAVVGASSLLTKPSVIDFDALHKLIERSDPAEWRFYQTAGGGSVYSHGSDKGNELRLSRSLYETSRLYGATVGGRELRFPLSEQIGRQDQQSTALRNAAIGAANTEYQRNSEKLFDAIDGRSEQRRAANQFKLEQVAATLVDERLTVGVTDVQKVPTTEMWQTYLKQFHPAGWGYNSYADREMLTARIGEYKVCVFNQSVSSAKGKSERETSAVLIYDGFQNSPQKVLLKGVEAEAIYNRMKSAEKPA